MTRFLLAALIAAAPTVLLAAGGGDDKAPAPTQTTTECKSGLVFDTKTKTCVAPKSGALDDDELYQAVREFAWAGQYGHATAALDAMSDQTDDRVMTYRGFVARKSGDVAGGMGWYRAALAANPDNILARSYMGQALVEQGDRVGAEAELVQIVARGGEGTWAELSLRRAIETGVGASY
jgi:hypothetical protein